MKIQELLFSDKQRVNDWMRNKYSSEDINRFLSEELGIDYEMLWNLFVSDCKTMKVDETDLKTIDSLRSKFIAVLMTDNMDCFERFTVPTLKLDEHFDLIESSHSRGNSKNDNEGKAYLDVIERIGSTIGSSVLIDDSPTTCGYFEKLGGRAFLVTNEKPLRYWLEKVTVILD
ncbi:MAG: hypothetical protein KGI45_00275 [Patescibacteria group bacterium]|nr:hypothetical protein [Patescibacteria group bacterium]MDE1966499.1 hypothetical protein [Patescibacteria group bacterium]